MTIKKRYEIRLRWQLVFSVQLIFCSIIFGQSNEYIKILDNGVQVKNLTAIALKHKEIREKMNGVKTMKGKSQYQKELIDLTHYTALDVTKKNEYTKEGRKILAGQYGNLSWYYIFDLKAAEARDAALKGLELDGTQLWLYTNLGHSYLLLNKLGKAKKAYKKIKDSQHRTGVKYSQIILEDFQKLKEENIYVPNLKRIKNFLDK